jgi:hypothetical protein
MVDKNNTREHVSAILPGSEGLSTPLFETPEDYERFREKFRKTVEPALMKNARRRAASKLASRTHFVRSAQPTGGVITIA